MAYTLEKIASFIGAHLVGREDAEINWLLTDSRSLCFPEDTLFFALETSRNDGHRYIPDLYRRGVRSFVVRRLPQEMAVYPGANFLQVVSPLKALQRLAERHREHYGQQRENHRQGMALSAVVTREGRHEVSAKL